MSKTMVTFENDFKDHKKNSTLKKKVAAKKKPIK
jgi:hypothetical protein